MKWNLRKALERMVHEMNVVLLSGGSGHRLWPLSNDARAKQFLNVMEKEDGTKESMLQRVWRQLESVGLTKNTMISTNKTQVDLIQNQLGPNIPLIIEPERRDTYPAVSLIASYLHSVRKVSLNETVAIIPVDSVVETDFFNKMKELGGILLSSNEIEIGLIGARPHSPSSNFGYIVPESNNDLDKKVLKISRFVEKPGEEQAKVLIEQNAFWNCGVFVCKLSYLIHLLQSKGVPIEYEELLKRYHELPKISFDYEVVEKASHLAVIPYNGIWKDIGTWDALTEEMTSNIVGKGSISRDCVNTHLINELDIPAAVIGLSNVVVVASPDGILVSHKDSSSRIKELVPADQRPH